MPGRRTLLALGTRITLFVAYAALTAVTTFYYAAYGHGTYRPTAVLVAWGLLPWQLEWVPGWAGLAAVPVGYLALLFLGSARLVRARGLGVYPLVPAIHGIGALLSLFLLGEEHLPVWFPFKQAMTFAVLVSVVFFGLDWFLLRFGASRERGGRAPEA
jgi:hypothetical protein